MLAGLTNLRKGPDPNEPFLAKLLAYIPAEIIAAYQALSGLVKPDPAHPDHLYGLQWFIVWTVVALVPAWMAMTTWSASHTRAWKFRVLASPLAFLVWTFVLGGPWLEWCRVHHPNILTDYGTYASVLLILVTLILPILEWVVQITDKP